ncbi:acetolactate synthase small subunit, partial [Selenomonas sp. F0473]|uniref:acetolactate synthase small subunit n=1 Tax=Selenomonas sp. F0473 TaxID=999423 RepID=UPI0025F4EA0B
DEKGAACRGMTMIKVRAEQLAHLQHVETIRILRAHVVDVDAGSIIFEITGGDDKVTAFLKVLQPYGIVEVIRTGLIALERGEHTIYEHCEERAYYGKNLL